jgi:hypothetical protein
MRVQDSGERQPGPLAMCNFGKKVIVLSKQYASKRTGAVENLRVFAPTFSILLDCK